MRTDTIRPGTAPDYLKRFAEALPARLQFSRLGGIWRSEVGGLNRVIHLWPYERFEDRDRAEQAARDAGAWPPAEELIIEQESKILQPAPFCPPLEARTLGGVYEFRTYTYRPGTLPTVLERFGALISERVKVSPLAGAWVTASGPLNQFVHAWAYKDAGERDRLRAQAMKLPGWPPATREFMVRQESALMVPAACSPLR